MIKTFRQYFGYVKDAEIEATYPKSFTFTDNLDLKTAYLKALDDQEGSRQSSIESKTSQLIGQTGIIFTILGLFIANYFSKFSTWPLLLQILLIVIFLVSFFFYLATIFQATKYLNVLKYKYGQRSVSTVKNKFDTEDDFKVEEIKDLIYSIERNTQVNNLKCNNLIYAYRSFRVGTMMVGLLSILLILSAFLPPKQSVGKMQIENEIVIKRMDTALKNLKYEIKNLQLSPVIYKDTCIKK